LYSVVKIDQPTLLPGERGQEDSGSWFPRRNQIADVGYEAPNGESRISVKINFSISLTCFQENSEISLLAFSSATSFALVYIV
jgi:hypothetical protein